MAARPSSCPCFLPMPSASCLCFLPSDYAPKFSNYRPGLRV